jgi:hypothetical protein
MRMPEEQVKVVIDTPAGPRAAFAIAMTVSQAEQDRQAEARRRYYGLAVERGHIRR